MNVARLPGGGVSMQWSTSGGAGKMTRRRRQEGRG